MSLPFIENPLQLPGKSDQPGIDLRAVDVAPLFHVESVGQFICQCADCVKVLQHRMVTRFHT